MVHYLGSDPQRLDKYMLLIIPGRAETAQNFGALEITLTGDGTVLNP